jgi:hypothetical protein
MYSFARHKFLGRLAHLRQPAGAALAATVFFRMNSVLAADVESVQLTYKVGSSNTAVCPNEASFKALVVARMGKTPFATTGARKMTVVLDAVRTGAKGTMTFTEHGKTSSKELIDASCENLVQALATSAALTIDPMGTSGDEPPASTQLPPAASAPYVAPLPIVPDPVPVEPQKSIAFYGRAGLVAFVGTLPTPSVGAELGVGMRISTFSIGASLRGETTVVATDTNTIKQLSASALSSTLDLCGHYQAYSGCLLPGVFFASGASGVTDPNRTGIYSTGALKIGARFGYDVPLNDSASLNFAADINAMSGTYIEGFFNETPPGAVPRESAWKSSTLSFGLSAGIRLGAPSRPPTPAPAAPSPTLPTSNTQ